MKNILSNVATVVLTMCAVVITGLVVRREFFAPAARAQPQIRQVDSWEAVARTGHIMGSPSAPVKIVEFSDFQCPFCSRAESTLEQLREAYPGRVAIIYRHFPLTSVHPYAVAAAVASECASAQGKFEAYHDALFASQDSLGVRSWSDFAEAVGVPDLTAFRTCVEDERFRGTVEADEKAGKQIGVNATPTFIVNGRLFSGSPAIEQWKMEIEKALADS